MLVTVIIGLLRWLGGKESACQCRRCEFDPWVGKILWRRKWQPTPEFLLGYSRGQRSLADYSPQNHKRVTNELATKQTSVIITTVTRTHAARKEVCEAGAANGKRASEEVTSKSHPQHEYIQLSRKGAKELMLEL